MNNAIFEGIKKIKMIASLNKNANRMDFAIAYKFFEDMKSNNIKIPELDCLKEYDSLQIPIDGLEMPESDKCLLDSLKQDDVVTFYASIDITVPTDKQVWPKYIKIWNIKKYKRPKAFELLSNLGRSQLFYFHFLVRVDMIITKLDKLIG